MQQFIFKYLFLSLVKKAILFMKYLKQWLWYEWIYAYMCQYDVFWHVHLSSGHSEWVTSVAFSPDGTQVVSGSDDKTIKIWNVESGDVLHTLYGEREYDDDSVWEIAIYMSLLKKNTIVVFVIVIVVTHCLYMCTYCCIYFILGGYIFR